MREFGGGGAREGEVFRSVFKKHLIMAYLQKGG